MSFLPMPQNSRKIVPGFGRRDAKIAIVGDYTSPFDTIDGRPFSGPVGDVFNTCLRAAGLIRGEIYVTNVFKVKTNIPGKGANYDFFDEKKKKFTTQGYEHAEMLLDELNKIEANVIVPAGLPALMALTDYDKIGSYRGYVTASTKLGKPRKLIPTSSFTHALRNHISRYIIINDLKKAKDESRYPEIRRPERTIVYDYDSIEDISRWLDYIESGEKISFDIEVINYTLAAVSLSISPEISVVVPLGQSEYKPDGWQIEEEAYLWRRLQQILGTNKPKIAQNGIFDIHFLATECGIVVRGPLEDTMIAHHVMHPELPKGLEFLGSIYCGAQEHWKNDVKFDNIKGES